MASINAEAVAHKVIKKVQNGDKINYGKIIASQGYAPSIALHPQKVTKTKSYIKAIEPILNQLERHRNKVIQAMASKDLDKESYDILVTSFDKLTKNIQLLNGGTTDNIGITVQISEAIARKNNISTQQARVLDANNSQLESKLSKSLSEVDKSLTQSVPS